MKIGTRSILFGVHQFGIHPWFVAWAWWQLYGFPWDLRLWVAFFVHDLGYWGKPNMDGEEGVDHPYLGAGIMSRLFDKKYLNVTHDFLQSGSYCQYGETWFIFCLYHSRFLAKKHEMPFSRLCVADKLAIALMPAWLYLPMAWLTGELVEYMQGMGRMPTGERSPREWLRDVQRYCEQWAMEHADCRPDTWTGTKRDLAREEISGP